MSLFCSQNKTKQNTGQFSVNASQNGTSTAAQDTEEVINLLTAVVRGFSESI
jgi:hypothetical protein